MKLRIICEDVDDGKVLINYIEGEICIGKFCREHNIEMLIKHNDKLPKYFGIPVRRGSKALKPRPPELGLFVKQASQLSDHYSELMEYTEHSIQNALDIIGGPGDEVFPDNTELDINFDPTIYKMTYKHLAPGFISSEYIKKLGIDPLNISDAQAESLVQQWAEDTSEFSEIWDGPKLVDCTITASVKFREYLLYIYAIAGLHYLVGEYKEDKLSQVINSYGQDVEAIYTATIKELKDSEKSNYDKSSRSGYFDELVSATKTIHKYLTGRENGYYTSSKLNFAKPSVNEQQWPADWRENPIDDFFDGPKAHLDVSMRFVPAKTESFGDGSTAFGGTTYYIFETYYTNDADDNSSEEKLRYAKARGINSHNEKIYKYSIEEEDAAFQALAQLVSKFEKM